jgi:hypothetical protein
MKTPGHPLKKSLADEQDIHQIRNHPGTSDKFHEANSIRVGTALPLREMGIRRVTERVSATPEFKLTC